jgi:hypothetical protein
MGTFKVIPTGIESGGTPYYVFPWDPPPSNTIAFWSVYDTADRLEAITNTVGIFDPGSKEIGLEVAGDSVEAYSITFNTPIRLSFSGSSIYLDGSATPISFGGLPSGFTLTAASLKIAASALYIGDNPGQYLRYYLQQGATDNGEVDTPQFDYSPSISMLNLMNNGCGLKPDLYIHSTGDLAGGWASRFWNNLRVEGTYEIAATSSWYYNAYTNHYQYASSDPGAPWTIVASMPAPTVTAVSPSSGSILGGTPVTITGTYFGD